MEKSKTMLNSTKPTSTKPEMVFPTQITFKYGEATKVFKFSQKELEQLDVAWLNKAYATWASTMSESPINLNELILSSTEKREPLIDYLLTKSNMKLSFLHERVALTSWESVQHDQSEIIRGYEQLQMVGKGGFSQVFLGRKVSNGQFVAMKRIQKGRLGEEAIENEFILHERANLKALRSPFLANLLGAFQTSKHFYFVTQYMPCGTLRHLVARSRTLSEEEICHFICEIISAMEFVHKAGYILRDLKTDNILLDENGHTFFCDMGLAGKGPKEGQLLRGSCGTVEYMAPEVLTRKGYDYTADYYSLGVIAYELSEGLPPFIRRSRHDDISHYVSFATPVIKKDRSDEFKDFVGSLLKKNPSLRLGAKGGIDQIVSHPWLSKVNFDDFRKRTNVTPSSITQLVKYSVSRKCLPKRDSEDSEEFQANLQGFTISTWRSEQLIESSNEIESNVLNAKEILKIPIHEPKRYLASTRRCSAVTSPATKTSDHDSWQADGFDWNVSQSPQDLNPEINNCLHLAPKGNAEILHKPSSPFNKKI